ncbi:MAG: nuclear transport factor 2 family protein, partial [Actinobacteria bacterium]|nr:nuclear transport factor 2 family protein [Actinomycetota bacterium]
LAAAGLSGRAVSCLDPDDPARAELLLTRCEALLGAGDVAAAAAAVDDLSCAAPGDSRLDAWATCFDVQLTSLVSTRDLGDAEGRLVTAAAVLAAAGDNAGAAKAHRVHASVLARLGRVGDCEAALDRALGAAREAGDRRQMTSVLSAAPLAALWGPSPVPRAGGRCLDVIRLVRITTGAPAVESTSIRCQAVLEAFRGRLDAARSLIGSARTIAEDLGLRHGLLEVELFAGIVELCGDDAAAAEDHLARAQEGFTAMGVTTDAAQAAALRGRAALALGRPDDALTYVATSEDLGGQDLKTSIAWRAVKAEVLAARGDVGAATELAEAAVAVAAPTDALIDHADALTALAHVLQAGGDGAAAQRIASEARALYEQKGATALAERLRQPVVAAPSPEGQPGPGSLTPIGNAASRAYEEVCRLTAAGTPEGIAAVMAANVVYEDRRPHFAGEVVGLAANIEQLRIVRELRVDSIDTQVVAVRGEHMAVVASQWHSDFEVALAAVVVTDDTGLITRGIHYDAGDLPTAMDDLDELYAEGLSPDDAKLVLASRAAVGTHLRRDWDAFHRVFTPDVRVVDHAPTGHAEIVGVEAFAEYAKAMVAVAPDYHMVVRRFVALGDRTMVGESISVVTGPAGGTYEHPRLLVSTIDEDGRVSCRESFELEQLEQAWARFHELSGGGDEIANDASRVYERVVRLALADRYDEVRELMAANRVRDDRRTGLMSRQEGAEASIENLRAVMQLGIAGVDVDVVALRGERLALLETHWHGEFEVAVLGVVGLDATGRSDLVVDFDSDALGDALEELDRLYIEMLPPAEAAQTRVHAALVQAHNRRDWDAFRRCWADDIVAINHGPASYGEIRGIEQFMELTKAMVDVAPDFKHVLRRILATSDRAVLVESTPPVVGSAGGEYVRVRYIVTRLRTPEGPIDLYETFEPEQLDEAWARYRELSNDEEDRLANTASRTYEAVNRALVGDRPDEALRLLAADVVRDDRRAGMQHRISGSAEVFPHLRAVAEIGITGIEMRVIAIRDDNLALVQFTWRSRFENTLLTLVRSNANGLIDLAISFDVADLRAALE